MVHECPLTDVDTRHVTYMALLSKLTLAPDHLENLLARGRNQSWKGCLQAFPEQYDEPE